METKETQSVEKSLDKIKKIEMSLMALKSKIICLEKDEARTTNNIEKTFTSSIPIIKNKIQQSKKHLKKEYNRTSNKKMGKNKPDIHDSQQGDINRTMQELAESKANQCQNVKEISRKNHAKIAEIKKNIIQQNKRKKQQIQNQRMKSKNRVEQFHLYKLHEIRNSKKSEELELQRKIQRAQHALQKLMDKEVKTSEKVKQNAEIYHRVKDMVDNLNRIKSQKFLNIMEKFNLNQQSKIDDTLVEKVLNQMENVKQDRKKKNQEKCRVNTEKQEGKQKQNRHQLLVFKHFSKKKSSSSLHEDKNSSVYRNI